MRLRPMAYISMLAILALIVTACSSSTKKAESTTSAAAGSSAASGASSAPTGAPIKIGFICACTGAQASANAQNDTIITAWEKYTNDNGGVNGHPIQVIIEREPNNPGVALTDVKDLVSQGIIGIIDSDGSSESAFQSYLESVNIPIFLTGSNTPAMNASKIAFSTAISSNYIGYEILEAAKKVGATKLGVFYCAEAPACAQAVTAMKSTAPKVGGIDVVFDASILASAPSYTAQCLAAKAKGVDALFIADAPAPSLAAAASCAQQGYTPHQVSDDGAYSASFAGAPGYDSFVATEDNIPFYDTSIPAAKAMHAAFDKYAPGVTTSPNFNEVYVVTWTTGLLITAGLKAGGVGTTAPITKDALFDGLYKLGSTNLDGMTPTLKLVKGQPPDNKCWMWAAIDNGKFSSKFGLEPACATP
jgi:branched-chain amino acid transport system substrate-binding protein